MDTIEVVSTHICAKDIEIKTVCGTIYHGWEVTVELSAGGHTATWQAVNLCETGAQSASWCREQCEAFIRNLGQFPSIPTLLRLACPLAVLGELRFPIPPAQPFWTDSQMLAYNARTGKPGVDGAAAAYIEWAATCKAWIAAHPELAAAYGYKNA